MPIYFGGPRAINLTNLLDGGKFKNTTYWAASNATYTVSGYVATATSTGTWACLYKDLAITSGHIYYSRVRVKYSTSTSHNGALLSFKPTSNAGGSSTATARASKYDGTWQSISIRTTVNYSDLRVHLYQPYTGSGTAMTDFTVQWNQPLLIDLTACFGAGNEPTKSWCDSNISFFDSSETVESNEFKVARRVRRAFWGDDINQARKILKGFIGDANNKAKLFYVHQPELIYSGSKTVLTQARAFIATAKVGDYALFAGGQNYDGTTAYTTVDAYNKSLTRSTPTALGGTRTFMAGASIGNYALFAGGRLTQSGTVYGTVYSYNTSLTRSTATALSTSRYLLASTTVGSYAVFGAGGASSGVTTTVNAYNTSLTRSSPTAMSTGRRNYCATTIGNYALFAGGHNNSSTFNTVETYNTSLTKSSATAMSSVRCNHAATKIGNYALFAGGNSAYNGGPTTDLSTVDAYNTSLTKSTVTALRMARQNVNASTVANILAVFVGGSTGTTIDTYTTSLTKNANDVSLNVSRGNSGVVNIDNYLLVAGGTWNSVVNTVEAFTYDN